MTESAAAVFPNSRILVFAKAPVSGLCKTRLGSRTGMQRAVNIHRRLVQGTIATLTSANLARVELHCAPTTRHPFFHQLARERGLSLRSQSGGGLGERMHRAMQRSLVDSNATIIIGTDCPALTTAHLQACLAELQENADAVFIPTTDGGYALIGLRKPAPLLFRDLQWGTAQVMRQTRQRLRRAALRWTEFAPLDDVDEYEDYFSARKQHPFIRVW